MEMKSGDTGLEGPPHMKFAFNNATTEENLCLTNATLVVENQHKDGKTVRLIS